MVPSGVKQFHKGEGKDNRNQPHVEGLANVELENALWLKSGRAMTVKFGGIWQIPVA